MTSKGKKNSGFLSGLLEALDSHDAEHTEPCARRLIDAGAKVTRNEFEDENNNEGGEDRSAKKHTFARPLSRIPTKNGRVTFERVSFNSNDITKTADKRARGYISLVSMEKVDIGRRRAMVELDLKSMENPILLNEFGIGSVPRNSNYEFDTVLWLNGKKYYIGYTSESLDLIIGDEFFLWLRSDPSLLPTESQQDILSGNRELIGFIPRREDFEAAKARGFHREDAITSVCLNHGKLGEFWFDLVKASTVKEVSRNPRLIGNRRFYYNADHKAVFVLTRIKYKMQMYRETFPYVAPESGSEREYIKGDSRNEYAEGINSMFSSQARAKGFIPDPNGGKAFEVELDGGDGSDSDDEIEIEEIEEVEDDVENENRQQMHQIAKKKNALVYPLRETPQKNGKVTFEKIEFDTKDITRTLSGKERGSASVLSLRDEENPEEGSETFSVIELDLKGMDNPIVLQESPKSHISSYMLYPVLWLNGKKYPFGTLDAKIPFMFFARDFIKWIRSGGGPITPQETHRDYKYFAIPSISEFQDLKARGLQRRDAITSVCIRDIAGEYWFDLIHESKVQLDPKQRPAPEGVQYWDSVFTYYYHRELRAVFVLTRIKHLLRKFQENFPYLQRGYIANNSRAEYRTGVGSLFGNQDPFSAKARAKRAISGYINSNEESNKKHALGYSTRGIYPKIERVTSDSAATEKTLDGRKRGHGYASMPRAYSGRRYE